MRTLDRLRWPLIAGVFLFSGCTEPTVAPKPFATQERADTMRDWNTVAERIAATMQQNGMLLPQGQRQPSTQPPYYIRVTAPGSTFLQVVANELEAKILQDGGAISRTPAGSMVINLDVAVVRWGPRNRPPQGVGTLLGTAAAAGILIGGSSPTITPLEGAGLALGMGAAADAVNAMTPGTNLEAAWTASIVSPDRVLFHLSEPIYVPANDLPLYMSETRLSPVASLQPVVAAAPRRISFAP